MLSDQLPGFLLHDELLLRIRVTPVTAIYSDGQLEGGSMPPIGPLGAQPRLLSGPALNWGYEVADKRLWSSRGFSSQRLPGPSAATVARQLEAAAEWQLKPAPWVETALQRLERAYSRKSVAWLDWDKAGFAAIVLMGILLPFALEGESPLPAGTPV